jgi:hypothetical protein
VSVIAGLLWLQIPYEETHVNDRYGLVRARRPRLARAPS